jgi:hypothetical protein
MRENRLDERFCRFPKATCHMERDDVEPSVSYSGGKRCRERPTVAWDNCTRKSLRVRESREDEVRLSVLNHVDAERRVKALVVSHRRYAAGNLLADYLAGE